MVNVNAVLLTINVTLMIELLAVAVGFTQVFQIALCGSRYCRLPPYFQLHYKCKKQYTVSW